MSMKDHAKGGEGSGPPNILYRDTRRSTMHNGPAKESERKEGNGPGWWFADRDLGQKDGKMSAASSDRHMQSILRQRQPLYEP